MNMSNQFKTHSFQNAFIVRIFAMLILSFSSIANSSTPSITVGLLSFSNVKHLGAFRLPGGGDTEYARGVIEINPDNNSFYMAGHEHRNHIAEFSIPSLISSNNISDLATATQLQDFQDIMQRASGGSNDVLERVGGLKLISDAEGNKKLIGTGYEYYDNSGQTYTHFVADIPNNLASTNVSGYHSIQGPGRKQSGYMVELPQKWQQIFGKTHIAGQSSGLAIIGDLSVGPAAFAVNLDEIGNQANPETVTLLEYGYHSTLNSGGSHDLLNESGTNDIWTHLSRASGVFISGDTIGFIGRSGGHHDGIGYKTGIVNPCGGTGGYGANNCDYDFHYWFYDLNELKKVMDGELQAHLVQPYEHGAFVLPWTVDNGASGIGGVATDPRTGYIYLTQLKSDTTEYLSHPTLPIVHVLDVGATTGSGPAPENRAPVLSSIGDKTIDTNAHLTFNVIASDIDNDAVSVTAQGLPSGATFNGSIFNWTPNSNQSGNYTITFHVTDGELTDSESVTITVSLPNTNTPPEAINDSTSTSQSTAISINVLINDSDADGDALTIASVTQGGNGSITINSNDTLSYSPNTGFVGVDNFSYTITDGNTGVATASVTVEVNSNSGETGGGGGSANEILISTEAELQNAVQSLKSNETLLLQAGTYHLTSPLYIPQGISNVTIKGNTGNHNDVVLVGKGMTDTSGATPYGIWANNIQELTIADLTIKEITEHAIILNSGVNAPHIYNVHLLDIGDQFLKTNPSGYGNGVNDGIIENSIIEYSTTAPDDYTNGVDVHGGKNWIIRNNTFRNIRAPQGQLAGPAILVWNGAENTLTEGNLFFNTQRGVSYGLSNRSPYDHKGGIIRNNIFYRSSSQSGDVAIYLGASPDTGIFNNTIISSGTYYAAIEYRYESTKNVRIINNLTDGVITARSSATAAEVSNNEINAQHSWFVDINTNNLHIKSTATAVIGQALALTSVTNDFEGNSRLLNTPDIGADEYKDISIPSNQPPVLASIEDKSIDENNLLEFNVTATDPNGDTITIIAQGLPSGATFNNNAFSWTPSIGQTGRHNIIFTASDGILSHSKTVKITVNAPSQDDQLLAYWSFDNDVTEDNSGNGHRGVVGGAEPVIGQVNNGLDFNGTNGFFYLGELDFPSDSTEMTISAWFKADDFKKGYTRIISRAKGNTRNSADWQISTTIRAGETRLRGRLKTSNGGTIEVNSKTEILTNQWVHVTMRYDGETLRIYLNGEQDGSVSKTGAIVSTPGVNLTIGVNPDGYGYFDGIIDEVRIYNHALSSNEIQELATVTGTIGGGNINSTPLVVNDTYSIIEGSTLNTLADNLPGVLANDSDFEQDTLTATVVTEPTEGNLTLNSDGTFIYQQNVLGAASDSFIYQVDDGNGGQTTGTVDIFIDSEHPPLQTNQLFAHWSFDTDFDNLIIDASGNKNNGTVSGATSEIGQVGDGLYFDGNNDFVDLGSIDIPNQNAGLTISAWFKADDFKKGYTRIISKAIGSTRRDTDWQISTTVLNGEVRLRGRLKTSNGGVVDVNGRVEITTNQWIHVAMRYDGSTLRLYQDGIETGNVKKTGHLISSPSVNVRIGANPDGYGHFQGVIDEVKIHNKALSSAEIQELMD